MKKYIIQILSFILMVSLFSTIHALSTTVIVPFNGSISPSLNSIQQFGKIRVN